MTGKPILDKILMGLNLVLLLAAFGVYLYTNVIYKRPLPEESASYKEFMADLNDQSIFEAVKIKKMTINLVSKSRRLRYLNVEPVIEPIKSRNAEAINQKKDFIKDIIIDVVSNLRPADLSTVSGKILLENKLKKRIDALFGRPTIRRVYFTHFIIQ